MIRLLWFYVDKFGCGTYRVYIPAYSLELSKEFVSSFIWQEECNTRGFYIDELREADIVILQRPLGNVFEQVMKDCRELGIKTIIEMDDNLFDIPRHNPAGWIWRKKPVMKQYKRMLEKADAVIVSTNPLKDVVSKEMNWSIERNKIFVCHNHLHDVCWGEEAITGGPLYENGDNVIIGWQGSTTHEVDFKEALPALKHILDIRPNVKLRLFGDVPQTFRNVIPAERFEWTAGVPYEMYPKKLRFVNFDIGLAPITPSVFNICKSNIKWLEYSVMRVPTVASKVYPYERSIRHGETGFVCSKEEEWIRYLLALVDNPSLRKNMGESAYNDVWTNWSSSVHSLTWAEAFKSLVGEKVDA